MSDKRKFPRAAAITVAKQICDVLKPISEKLIVAGSLRRRKELVGDIEIVFIPKFDQRPDRADIFGTPTQTNLVVHCLDAWLEAGTIQKRPKEDGTFTWGPQNKLAIETESGIPVDFFEASRDNWFTLLVCRTGSAENNERICNAAIERGLKWDPYAGFCDRKSGQLLHVPRSEPAVFERVGLKYLEPWER